MIPLSDHYRQIAPSLPKVCIKDAEGTQTVGTGICIGPGLVSTCAHVILGKNRLNEVPEEELADWHSYYDAHIRSLTLLDDEGNDHPCEIILCDPALDIALLRTDLDLVPLEMDQHTPFLPGMDVVYYGYAYTIHNDERDWPLSIYRGGISALADACVGGSRRRQFAALHGMALGGTSGGPVFDSASGALIGMVNGHMFWGTDNVLINERNEQGVYKTGDTYVPTAVGFVTPFSYLREQGIHLTSSSASA